MLIPLCGPDLDWAVEMRLTAFSVGPTHKFQSKKEKQFLNCQKKKCLNRKSETFAIATLNSDYLHFFGKPKCLD